MELARQRFLYASRDGWTQNTHVRHNFKRDHPAQLYVWTNGHTTRHSYIRFELPRIGVMSGLAELTLYLEPATATLPVDVDVHALDERKQGWWNELSLTWQESPTMTDANRICTLKAGARGSATCDITQWMNLQELELLENGGTVALGLRTNHRTGSAIAFSSSNTRDASKRPRVTLQFTFP